MAQSSGARLIAMAFGIAFNAAYLKIYSNLRPRWDAEFLHSGQLSSWALPFLASVLLLTGVWTGVLVIREPERQELRYWISTAADIAVLWAIFVAQLMLDDPALKTKLIEVGLGNLRQLLWPIAAAWFVVYLLRRSLMTKHSAAVATPK